MQEVKHILIDNIFAHLFTSSNFFRIALPHLKTDYFDEIPHSVTLKKIHDYYEKYNKQPQISDIKLLIEADNSITLKQSEESYVFLDSLKKVERVTEELLIPQTEGFIQDRAVQLAIYDSLDIMKNKDLPRGILVDKMKAATSIEFDVKIGHDYFQDAYSRMNSYMEEEDKIPLDIELLNVAMGGGLVRKAIFLFLANTNVGKTVWLCHCASSLVRSGKNVLIITAEMSEKEINKRVDANLLDIPISTLSPQLDKNQFMSNFKALVQKNHGELIVKETGAGVMNANHIRNLLHEIKLKKGFLPDVLILDHLTLFSSSRLPASQTGSHIYVQCVIEEIRAVLKEFDIAGLTAAQFNRGAKSKGKDAGNEDVGLGYGISQTSDWSGAVAQTPELKEQNKYILSVAKTRFASNNNAFYTIGIKYENMRLFNLDESEQEIPLHIKDQLNRKLQEEQQQEESGTFGFNFN